jgi:Mg/Co/Ni transporter MgtE
MMTFEELVDEFMSDEYSPYKVNNLLEAMEQTSKEQGERLQELLENRDFETLGRWIWNHTVEVMEGYAVDRANYEIDSRTPWDEK